MPHLKSANQSEKQSYFSSHCLTAACHQKHHILIDTNCIAPPILIAVCMTSSLSSGEDWWIFTKLYIIRLDAGLRKSVDMGILRRDM